MKESNAIILGYISLIIMMTMIDGVEGFVASLYYIVAFAPVYLIVLWCEKQEKPKEQNK